VLLAGKTRFALKARSPLSTHLGYNDSLRHMRCESRAMPETKRKPKTGATRTEVFAMRLDPKLKYLAEIGASKQRRSLANFVELSIAKYVEFGKAAACALAAMLWTVIGVRIVGETPLGAAVLFAPPVLLLIAMGIFVMRAVLLPQEPNP
jgi:hypothetical protein